MKRNTLILCIAGIVLFGVFSAQSANAQNTNMAQKIIGTWVDQEGYTWVFNANGTLKWTILGDSAEFKFAVADTKLATYYRVGSDSLFNIYTISISSDGKTLILETMNSGRTDGFWLTKK